VSIQSDLPPTGADAAIDDANRRAVELICAAEPVLVGVRPARDVMEGLDERTVLTSGPPLPWEEYTGGQRRAILALQRSYQDQLEATFWSGSSGHGAPVFPNLTTVGPVLDETGFILLQPAGATQISGTAGVALDVVEAVGRLEGAMAAAFSGVGVIHVPASLGAALFSRNLCYKQGAQLRTYAGNYVAIGQGYPGTGPNGAAPAAGSTWIRATSRPWAIAGDIRSFPPVSTLDRNVDTVEAIAEQTWLIGWNCGGPLGVLVTLGGEQAGAFGTDKQDT